MVVYGHGEWHNGICNKTRQKRVERVMMKVKPCRRISCESMMVRCVGAQFSRFFLQVSLVSYDPSDSPLTWK